MALCALQQLGADGCGGNGTPSGTANCDQTALCQGTCDAQNAPASCGCACNRQLDPKKALSLLINDACSSAKCPVQCGPPPAGNGPSCLACFAQVCQAENAQCVAN